MAKFDVKSARISYYLHTSHSMWTVWFQTEHVQSVSEWQLHIALLYILEGKL